MRFGPVPLSEAEGAISAHTVRTPGLVLRKGETIAPEAALRLGAEGMREIVAARLDAGDVGEDEAAAALAGRLTGEGLRVEAPATGRCNLFASVDGLVLVERAVIDAVNSVDEGLTVATLPPFRPVTAGEMVATVKVIPYAVPGALLREACAAAGSAALGVAPYRRRRVGVVSTLLPGLKPATVEKTLRALRGRLDPAGAVIAAEERVADGAGAVAEGIAAVRKAGIELVVLFGASAIADRRDVIPGGIELAGGTVEHLGMPVDPGNLLLLGSLGDLPVIGAPGCARSPHENGFDWVLRRLLAGLPVTRADIVALGVGGLLLDTVRRPHPRIVR